MRKYIALSLFGLMMIPGMAGAVDLQEAIKNAKATCSGISDSLHDMKVKAGINTAVTAVGTVTGVIAVGAGIAKAQADKIESLEDLLKQLRSMKEEDGLYTHIEMSDQKIRNLVEENPDKAISRLEEKSKQLGNVRTGTLAVSAMTNIAGTAIAATNKVDADLEENVQKCIDAVKELSNARLAAKMEQTATDSELAKAEKIVNGCHEYETIDLKPINKRARGAAVASGISAGAGVVGTITSAVSNTNNTRAGNENKEKGLNATSNVMAGASTAASATATIFNATQISAIKKVAAVADACEEALK